MQDERATPECLDDAWILANVVPVFDELKANPSLAVPTAEIEAMLAAEFAAAMRVSGEGRDKS